MILQQSICKTEAFNMRVHSGKENPFHCELESQTGIICAMEGEDFNLFIFTDTSKTTETSFDIKSLVCTRFLQTTATFNNIS